MTRSRSGSFYCPLEPAWAPLSISQKAAISTAHPPPPPTTSSERPPRRHSRSPSFRIGSEEYEHPSTKSPTRLFLSTPDLSNVYGFGTNAVAAPQPQPLGRRHAHSPARPSPLRGESLLRPAKPLCPSAIWTCEVQQSTNHRHHSHHHHHHHRSRASPNGSCSTLHRSVLKSAFIAGPMARKARMYGLRVAWCVFGDARVEMAKGIFGRGSTSAGIVGDDEEHAKVQHEESVEMPMHEHEPSFEWEADSSQAKSRIPPASVQEHVQHSSASNLTYDYSYLELEQLDSESDSSDSGSSSDSDYDSPSDEEIERAESDELDDEDEIQRHVMAAFELTHLTSGSPLNKYAHDDAHWEVISFEG